MMLVMYTEQQYKCVFGFAPIFQDLIVSLQSCSQICLFVLPQSLKSFEGGCSLQADCGDAHQNRELIGLFSTKINLQRLFREFTSTSNWPQPVTD